MKRIKILVIEGEETKIIGECLKKIAAATKDGLVDVVIERENEEMWGEFEVAVFPTEFNGVYSRVAAISTKKIAVTSHQHGIKLITDFNLPFRVEKEYIYCADCAREGLGDRDALNFPAQVAEEIYKMAKGADA